MTHSISRLGAVLSLLALAGCTNTNTHAASGPSDTPEPAAVPARAFATVGTAEVKRGEHTQTFGRWSSSFTITQEKDSRDSLELVLSARASDGEKGDFLNVTISRERQLEKGPISLVGSYDIAFKRSPATSGTVTLGWAGAELRDPWQAAHGERHGNLTITSHSAGRITGELSSVLEDGTRVTATFDGEVSPRCRVLATDVEGDVSWRVASFEDDFCAQYFFL